MTVRGYRHPLRDFLFQHDITSISYVEAETGVDKVSLRRIMQGHGCTHQTAVELIEWSWDVSIRALRNDAEGLRNEDLLPDKWLQERTYPVGSSWKDW